MTTCRAQCAALAAQGVAVDDDEACVVDVFRSSPPPESSPARTQRPAYVAARRSEVARCCGPEDEREERHAAIEHALFDSLPRALLSACLGVRGLYLFNEQYVVKPARSAAQFAWHRDGEEQLALCTDVDTRAPYWSVWLPLDDCDEHNGTLVVRPGLQAPPPDGSRGGEGLALSVAAGSAVAFGCALWHASSPNRSAASRRVFYAQFSAAPITSKDGSPLAFAVPVWPLGAAV